jgi:hypothetical protein
VKDRASLDACIAALAPEDVRAEFEAAFRRFAESMDILLPDPEAARFNLIRADVSQGEVRERRETGDESVDEAKRALAGIIEDAVAEQIGIVDWTRKDDVKREMRRKIKRHLTASGYTPDHVELLAQTILHLLQVRDGG